MEAIEPPPGPSTRIEWAVIFTPVEPGSCVKAHWTTTSLEGRLICVQPPATVTGAAAQLVTMTGLGWGGI